MNDRSLQDRTTELIKSLVPETAEERVVQSVKQWNQVIRDHIRAETGLKLSDGEARCTISVRVVRGFPDKLAELIDQYRDPVVWRLVMGQPKLGALIDGLEFLIRNWNQIEQWPKLPQAVKDSEPVLHHCREIASLLQQAALAEKVPDQIKAIREDILGAYCASSVELFWLPIAMVSAMLDVSIEDVTVVVLIHELAHGYTHVGRDIDGTHWADRAFEDSAPEVVEGLAQFYTEAICRQLAPRTPGIYAAYQKLLKLQSGPYLVHQDWLKGDKTQRGEAVRFSLIAARRQGRIDYEAWQRLMTDTSRSLERHFDD